MKTAPYTLEELFLEGAEMKPMLIADDDPAVLRLMIRVLAQAGLSVAAVGTGADLLKAWNLSHCKLVLSDVMMPGEIDGIEACRAIKKSDPGVSIFLMTGDPESKIRAEQYGFKIAFTKPFLIPDVMRWAKTLRPAANFRR